MGASGADSIDIVTCGDDLLSVSVGSADEAQRLAEHLRARGEWREAVVRERPDLAVGERIEGPAVIVDATSTTIVEPGWSVTLQPDRQLALKRP